MQLQKKAIRYLRFSSDGQSNSSIEWQDHNTEYWCKNNNVIILDTFIDAGQSAKTFNRPDFENLSTFVTKHHKEINYLVVSQLDRFSRDAGEAISLIKKLQLKYNIQIVSVTEGITYDHQTPGSLFRSGLQLLLAEDENINRAQKINSGIYIAKTREARYIGPFAPYGYKKSGQRKDAHLVIDEQEAKVINYIFESYLSNLPIKTIYTAATKMGLKKRGNSVIPKILTNPIYSGQQLVKPWKDMPGGLFPAKHEAIIDMLTWNQVQYKIKRGISNNATLANEMPLRGLLNCHCGRKLTGAASTGRHGGKFYYYKCNSTSTHNNLSANKIHQQMQDMLGYLSVPAHTVTAVKKASEKLLDQQLNENKLILQQRKNELAIADQKLISLEDKWILDQMNFDTYNRWHNDLTKQRVYLRAEIEKLGLDNNEYGLLLQDNLHSLTDMQFLYNKASIADQQTILGIVFDNRLYYQNNIYRTPYLMDIFQHNTFILKQKQLLELDEKRDFRKEVPVGGAAGSYIEPLSNLLSFIQQLRVA